MTYSSFAPFLPVIVLTILTLVLLLLVWLFPPLAQKLKEALFRNIGVPYRNLVGLSLGITASFLPLTNRTWSPWTATWIFIVSLTVIMVSLVVVRPNVERELDRFAWGLLVVTLLGFGVGALIFEANPWWVWLWQHYLRINNADPILLESLFLLGVILGFFIVRNWAKEQKDFLSSLSAVLSGAFVATILGKLQEGNPPAVTPMRAFAFYALGFTMSGSLNLIAAAWLTANYVNKRSIKSRAIMDFLYGSERAEIIDGYFLKKFKEDPDFAKGRLTDTLHEYQKLVKREFANRMEQRRKHRKMERRRFGDAESMDAAKRAIKHELKDLEQEIEAAPVDARRKEIERRHEELESKLKEMIEIEDSKETRAAKAGKIIEVLEGRLKQLKPCSQLRAIRDQLKRLRTEEQSIDDSTVRKSKKQESRLHQIRADIQRLEPQEQSLSRKCDEAHLEEWLDLEHRLSHLKPSYFYQLIAIECEEDNPDNPNTAAESNSKDSRYNVVYKYLGSGEAFAESEHSLASHAAENLPAINDEMFRVGVALRWHDFIEYIVAPGEFGGSFPFFGSVAGLALNFRQIIIMDRDRLKTFRNHDHPRGFCPDEIEQDRGLDEIDYLSYVSIPIVNPVGDPSERGVGIVNIDTKIFVTPLKLDGESVKACEGIFRTRLTPRQLTEFANNLYEQDDEDVKYIDELTRIITPVMALYSKCRVGATVTPA